MQGSQIHQRMSGVDRGRGFAWYSTQWISTQGWGELGPLQRLAEQAPCYSARKGRAYP